jgi:hypothetical protein
MKSNPLLLGNKKLHAATNLVFEEGVIKTRPGFRYESLGAEGQFQGACEYRPKEGLSAAVLSEADSGTAVVADGVLWFNGNPISEALFEDAGAVHLYQAENYLVLQNPATDTFWWDGLGELVRSPGMNEQDWTEPEVPVFEMEVVAPEADIPDCNIDGAESGINVRFLVLNHNNEKPIASVLWTVGHNKRKAYSGLGGADGRFAFSPVPRAYTYSLDRAGYLPVEGIPMVINGIGVPHVWDECLPPTITQVGEYDFVVRMKPLLLEKQCLATGQTFIYTDEETIVPNQRRITLTNNEDVPLTLFALTPFSPSVTITGPARPVTVAPDETVEFLITGTGDLTGEVLAADMDCTDSPTEIVLIGNCSYVLEHLDVVTIAGPGCTGVFVVRNTGDSVLTVTSYNGPGGVSGGLIFAHVIPAGEFGVFLVFYSDEFFGQPFTFTTLECGVSSVYYWPTVCNPSDDYIQENYFPE